MGLMKSGCKYLGFAVAMVGDVGGVEGESRENFMLKIEDLKGRS